MQNGYGLFSCFNNPLSVDNNAQYFHSETDSYFPSNYTHPTLLPMLLFGDIHSVDPEESVAFIAGRTSSAFINNLRVFVSYMPIPRVNTIFRKFLPNPSACPALPSPLSCSCVPIETVKQDDMTFNHYVRYHADACSASRSSSSLSSSITANTANAANTVNAANTTDEIQPCEGIKLCSQQSMSFDFQVGIRSEVGKTSPKLDVDGTPLLESIPLLSFPQWFHDNQQGQANTNTNTYVKDLPRMPRTQNMKGKQYNQ